MSVISVELVPRSIEGLRSDLSIVQQFSQVSAINIPDLLSCPIRSWNAASIAREFFPRAIAHVRAIDINPHEKNIFIDQVKAAGIRELLVVHGDIPQQFNRPIYSTTTLQAIELCRESLSPDVLVYAAIDPYRSGLRKELDYAREKIMAGACGFFTQPFFDFRFLQIVAEQLESYKVFWGITPVVTIKAQEGYWETKNNVVFPKNFRPTLEWNQEFARQILDFLVQHSQHDVYLMPIKVDIKTYLAGIFS